MDVKRILVFALVLLLGAGLALAQETGRIEGRSPGRTAPRSPGSRSRSTSSDQVGR